MTKSIRVLWTGDVLNNSAAAFIFSFCVGRNCRTCAAQIIIQMLQLEDRIYPLLTFFAPCCSTEIIEMPPALAYFWFEMHCLAECADQCSSDHSLVLGDETGTTGLWIVVQVLIDTLKTTQQLDRCQDAFFLLLSQRASKPEVTTHFLIGRRYVCGRYIECPWFGKLHF